MYKNIKFTAVRNLVGDEGQFLIREDIVIFLEGTPSFTEQAIEAEILRLQTEADATQYQRQRVVEYPAIGDQLDALFHAGVFPAEMAAAIQAIKDKYPKGSA